MSIFPSVFPLVRLLVGLSVSPHLYKRACPLVSLSVRPSARLTSKSLEKSYLRLLNEGEVRSKVQGGSKEHQGGGRNEEEGASMRIEGRGVRSDKEEGTMGKNEH